MEVIMTINIYKIKASYKSTGEIFCVGALRHFYGRKEEAERIVTIFRETYPYINYVVESVDVLTHKFSDQDTVLMTCLELQKIVSQKSS